MSALANSLRAAIRALSTKRQPAPGRIPFHRTDWSHDTLAAALASMADDERPRFEADLRTHYGLADKAALALVGSGRTALDLALTALKAARPERTKVVVPTYCCPAIIPPILNNGLTPVFIDTTSTLISRADQYREALSPEILAVVVVHLCGRRLQARILDELLQSCRDAGVFSVEDNCQDIARHRGAREFDASIFSFGFAKPIRSTAGGALVMHSHTETLRDILSGYPEQPDEAPITRARYYAARFGVSATESDGHLPDADAFTAARIEFGRVRMSTLDAFLARESLRGLAQSQVRVEAHSHAIDAALSKNRNRNSLFCLDMPDHNAYVRWPLILSDETIAGLFWSYMNERGIELEGMYKPLHLMYDGEKIGDLGNSEAIYKRVYNIPNRSSLDRASLARVTQALRAFAPAR